MRRFAENTLKRAADTFASLRRAWPDGLALVVLLLLALAFFWPVTLDRGWIPHGGGDLVSLLWPHYSYAAQSLHEGRIPFWNPTLQGGSPFAADNQTSLFYPINLVVFLLFPSLPFEVVEWLVIAHTWIAGAGMYWLVRVLLSGTSAQEQAASSLTLAERARRYLPPLFSGVAFMLSSVFITHIGNLNLNAVSAWLPAVFAALYLAFTRRSFGWAAGAGVLLGFSVLAGHAQMSLILILGLGLYVIWHVAGAHGGRLRALALTGVMGLVAFGLTALTIIPTIEMLPLTARVKLDYAAAASYSIPWAGLGGLFTPLVFGRGPAGFWAPWERVELGYLGVLPLLFAGLAPFKKRRGITFLMVLVGVFGLLAAMGKNAPLHRLLYWTVPGFSGMRVPARFILLADFSLAVLAGLGLWNLGSVSRRRLFLWSSVLLVVALAGVLLGYRHAVAVTGTAHDDSLRTGLLVGVGLLLVGVLLAFWTPKFKVLAPVLALAVLSVDLVGLGAFVEVGYNDPTTGFQHPAVVEYLEAQSGPFRIDSAPGAWAPSASARFGLEHIGGTNHALVLAAYQTYLNAVGWRGSPVYNFLNAKYVIADKGQPPGDATFVPVFDQDPAVDVYLNTNAIPRVNLVYSATRVATGEAAFEAVHAPAFDPLQNVVIEDTDAPLPGDTPSGGSRLYYARYEPEVFTVVAQTPAPGYVVFSEVWYPGWRAWVDGVRVPVYRANFAFRAVYLESAGEHTVEMRFEPSSWTIGLAITGVTLLVLIGWAIYRLLLCSRGTLCPGECLVKQEPTP